MMKRIGTAALALTLAATLAPAALANEAADLDYGSAMMPISGNPNAYASVITLNGEKLSTVGIPKADASLIPMRLIAESDFGSASWYEEENTGSFYMNKNYISVDFNTGAVSVNDVVAEDVAAVVTNGVTFLPVTVLNQFEGYSVILNDDTNGVEEISISTPNGAPLMKLTRQIMEETEMGSSMLNDKEELESFLGIDPANFDEVIAFSSMMINSDTIVLGKLAEKADADAAKEQLEARRAAIQQSFEQYLPGPLEKAKNGQIVEKDGYLMLIISPDVEKSIELFEAGVAALETEAE